MRLLNYIIKDVPMLRTVAALPWGPGGPCSPTFWTGHLCGPPVCSFLTLLWAYGEQSISVRHMRLPVDISRSVDLTALLSAAATQFAHFGLSLSLQLL